MSVSRVCYVWCVRVDVIDVYTTRVVALQTDRPGELSTCRAVSCLLSDPALVPAFSSRPDAFLCENIPLSRQRHVGSSPCRLSCSVGERSSDTDRLAYVVFCLTASAVCVVDADVTDSRETSCVVDEYCSCLCTCVRVYDDEGDGE